jgi:hypothetical protein
VRAAFVATGAPYAADAVRGASEALDAYAGAWASMHTEACEATRVRGEQSEELLDLRMECLARRLEETRALVEVLARADAPVVVRAAQAARSLSPLEGCANVAALRAPVAPEASIRAQVEELRGRLGS